ncbi:MAG: hypothetical protein IJK67_03820 [Bacilli bacterium]|nr:hypothetical protein [Bacilli bacterium]
MNIQKEFSLGALLSVATGRLYCTMDELYEILNYLTGESLFTHQIPRATTAAKPYVLSLYPQLVDVGVNEQFNNEADVFTFIEEQKRKFGDKFVLSPMTKNEGYAPMDPLDELARIRNGMIK